MEGISLESNNKCNNGEFSCFQYGFIIYDDTNPQKATLEKLIAEEESKNDSDIGQDDLKQKYLQLGTLNLLIENYAKALSAYQKYHNIDKHSWKESAFLYGMGMAYLHFKSYTWSIKALRQFLYLNIDHHCCVEVNIRLAFVFKLQEEFELSVKHFDLAIMDNSPSTVSKHELIFNRGQVIQLQGDYMETRRSYEGLLNDENVAIPLKANILKHLGWMYHSDDRMADEGSRESLAIHFLRKSVELDATSGQAWYFLGRCLSSLGKVHDAFVSYRHSIDKSEASADTWCSIGVLYQQQNQCMDALQAYICAVQLDRNHNSAWNDLGLLYESCNQLNDSLVCYANAIGTNKEPSTSLLNRVKVLQYHLNNTHPQLLHTKPKSLPSIEEAWTLPIPVELTSRQTNTQQPKHLATPQQLLPDQPLPKKRKLEVSEEGFKEEQGDVFENELSEQVHLGDLSRFGPPPTPPPSPPQVSDSKLSPAVPSIYLENKKDVFSIELQQYCLSQSVCIIRGLAGVLKLDLGLFSTKSLVESNPDHKVELRSQRLQGADENTDVHNNNTWTFESTRSYTNVCKYAQYQAASFQESLKGEDEKSKNVFSNKEPSDIDSVTSLGDNKKGTIIKFGTNVDISDENKWRAQLQELTKLPSFVRVVSASNMLSHVGYDILGVNTVQLYMKVPGSRTPGHQENNSFCGVNINTGPGDCEWFAVPHYCWGAVYRLCQKNNVNFLTGSWWPSLSDLRANHIPVYRFIQKPGDLVWLGPGTIHWVQSIGWCNNIAWNVGPLTWKQYQLALDSHRFNKSHLHRSLIPVTHLSWNLARNIRITDVQLYEIIRQALLSSMEEAREVLEGVKEVGRQVVAVARQSDQAVLYCNACEAEIFSVVFVLNDENIQNTIKPPLKYPAPTSAATPPSTKTITPISPSSSYCMYCARKMDSGLEVFQVLCQYPLPQLIHTYDNFQLGSIPQKNSDTWLSW